MGKEKGYILRKGRGDGGRKECFMWKARVGKFVRGYEQLLKRKGNFVYTK